MRTSFYHEISHDHLPEDAGTIRVTATIFGDGDGFDTAFTTSSRPIQDFFGSGENKRKIVRELIYFLLEYDIDADTIRDAMMNLIDYVGSVTCSTSSSGYSPGRDLSVGMDIYPYYLHDAYADDDDDSHSQIEEAVQVSFDETSNNTRFRPASKVVVKTLIRKVYKKKIEKENMEKKKKISLEECTICLEEFKNGGRVVPLACGHEFDEECIVKWLETSHVCPLCRFKLACEDQMN